MARCFLGFELSETSRVNLHAHIERFYRRVRDVEHWPIRLVRPENWHATLLFFPELDEAERRIVWAAVEDAAAAGAWRAPDFAWRGLALWPSPRRPALVCLEAEPYAGAAEWPLLPLLNAPPFNRGEVGYLRRYVPHVTLMRFKRGPGVHLPSPRDWVALQPALPLFDPVTMHFDRLSFFLSTNTPAAPIYPREYTLVLQPPDAAADERG